MNYYVEIYEAYTKDFIEDNTFDNYEEAECWAEKRIEQHLLEWEYDIQEV